MACGLQPESRANVARTTNMRAGSNTAIVVITRNRCASLFRTLRRLQALPERPPIVVVDNASEDGTPRMVRSDFPDVDLVALERNLGAAGRNVGVARTDRAYVAFADDDSSWAPGALTAAEDVFAAYPRLALIAARVLVGEGSRLDPVCYQMQEARLAAAPDLPGPRVLGFLSCGAIVRREAFLQVDGFSERFGVGGEERLVAIDLAARGYALAYVDSIVAYHDPQSSSDRSGRQARLVRNALWSAWLRRRSLSAVRETARTTLQAARNLDARRGLVEALRGLPWALRERRPVPAHLEADLHTLEQ